MTTAIGPGMRVVCVHPDNTNGWKTEIGLPHHGPAHGSRWTVEEVKAVPYVVYSDSFETVHVLKLKGWVGPEWYDVREFRPLDGIDNLLEPLRKKVKDPDSLYIQDIIIQVTLPEITK